MIPAAWICLLSPLAATLLITLGWNRLSRRGAGYLATLSVAVSFVAAVVSFVALLGDSPKDRYHPSTLWQWLTAGQLDFGLRIVVDPLSTFMMLIVSGVGMLIVAYSIGYMEGDDEERRYFAYMACSSSRCRCSSRPGTCDPARRLGPGRPLLVPADRLLARPPSAVAAAKKAFVINAIGDATFALALFLLIQRTGSLNFEVVFTQSIHGSWAINLIALGLLGGAVAKSAQLPLHTWLPDAMEGPTPVSALIHAATMVTAGVYLIVRTGSLFEQAPKVLELAAGLGAITIVMAGLIALVQVDIKRVIAYSTMSQIGYMFLAAGLGAYPNAMFHLMTHAFFKALLFMAAGLVIHAPPASGTCARWAAQPAAAVHVRLLRDRSALAVGHPAVRGLLFEGLDPRRRARRRLVRRAALGRRDGRHLPDGPLRLPDAVHRLLGPAVGVRARASG
jgi:NADH-quinone oxidoreductase subunit L